ncbi:hypothetical protein CPter91_2666 [Collimonas pratensis]|uniref:Uncharacterized protein n=1 Tax=Collimonas pratensis TaxID=279113 RepID=A0A127Q4P7_9BURK|nr:hypothetical protein CPter91_2666 [Collimonas pratensis]
MWRKRGQWPLADQPGDNEWQAFCCTRAKPCGVERPHARHYRNGWKLAPGTLYRFTHFLY